MAKAQSGEVDIHRNAPAHWQQVTLGDYAEVTKGVSYKGEHLNQAGPLLLGLGEFSPGGGAKLDKVRTYAGEYRESHLARPGDLLVALTDLTQTGAVLGSPMIVPSGSGEFCLYTHHVGRVAIRDPKSVDGSFLRYLLQDFAFSTFVFGRATGTTVRAVHPREVAQFEFPLPPLEEQRAIARVLGALDDRIELNRRMSETLEEMARALFRSWFVDFDPVRAKAEGRPSGLPPDLDALFPASFEASELGEIPAGWEVKTLEDIFELAVGGAWGKDAPDHKATELVHCLRGIDCHALAEDRVPEAPVRWLTPRQLATRRLPPGTILIEGSGSFCGRSLLWSDEMSTLFEQPVTYSNFVKRLDRTGCSISQAAVVWQFMRRAYRDREIQLYRTGTAFPNLDVRSLLSTLNVVVPPEAVADLYVRPCAWDARLEQTQQSQTLSRLRDALLPRLVSGELRVGV